ncbi:MAG: NADH:ubiquinone reductase (Na(+)-transporting) subunit B [Parachlamydiales bacterium]
MGQKESRLLPVKRAIAAFMREVPDTTKRAPHIRDGTDLKRWMMLVVIALLPCTLMAIWNTGIQKLVYTSGSADLMEQFFQASTTFRGYFAFSFAHLGSIIGYGLGAFLPLLILSYAVGGFWEALFATIRGHEISEGFLVTGLLYALILPPTLPYWMVIFGISFGVIVGKELFGGTGKNILNPALTCRVFLFFAFPGQMTGNVWVGTNPTAVYESLLKINQEAKTASYDAFSQATPCARLNLDSKVARLHVDAIALGRGIPKVSTGDIIERQAKRWDKGAVSEMKGEALQQFVTAPLEKGGLGLPIELYDSAWEYTTLRYGLEPLGSWTLFFGNRLGSVGETSILFSLLGAALLIFVGIGSWRTMAAVAVGALAVSLLFSWGAHFGVDGGAWNPAKFAFPIWKQFLIGSLVFGLVFMATEPVTSPYTRAGKWLYGLLIGALVIIIRLINPAYPEGVMLSILFGNVFAPLIDHYLLKRRRFA